MSHGKRTLRVLGGRREDRSESGAALVMVLVLLLIGGLLMVAMGNAASNDLLNTGSFAKARSLSYDATTAIGVAIQSIRYTPLLSPTQTLNASPPASCWPTTTTWPIGEPTLTRPLPNTGQDKFLVWCSTRWTPASPRTRTVTFSACTVASLSSKATLSSTLAAAKKRAKAKATACAAHPLVQEVVAFDDYPAGKATPSQAPCLTYCGSFMTVEGWVEHATMPTVSYLSCARGSTSCTASPLGGPSSGGTTINVIGSGFVRGSTVQFVEESAGTPVSDNEVLTASKVTFVSSGSLTVAAPPVTEGSSYYVTVTTPVGTSAYGSSDVFTYSAAVPTVKSVCTGPAGTSPTGSTQHTASTCNTTSTGTNANGAISGGTEVTIWGTNFLCLSSCGSGGGPAVYFGSLQAQYVTIVSTTEITATTPGEYATVPPKAFSVTVKTPGGTSSASVGFDYVAIVPTVESVSPATVTTKVTVKGTGFVTGDTVSFVPAKSTGAPTVTSRNTTTSRNAKSASSVTVETATTITATVPSLTAGERYFVRVTTPNVGKSSYYSTFKYV